MKCLYSIKCNNEVHINDQLAIKVLALKSLFFFCMHFQHFIIVLDNYIEHEIKPITKKKYFICTHHSVA